MKLLPAKATRFIGRSKLKLNQNSPTILLAAGIVGVVGTVVLSSRATLHAQPVMEKFDLDLQKLDYNASQADHPIDPSYLRQKRVGIYTDTAIRLTKLYGPAVVLGGISIGCLIKGHKIQSDRYSNLAAAYVGLQETFDNYRGRVREELGDEKEKELFYAGREQTVIEAGPNGPKKRTETKFGEHGGSPYAKLFGPDNKNWKNTPEFNTMWLRQVEDYCNLMLRTRGHLFLNRVYEELGMEDTEAGAVVGWLYERGNGDDYIDFGVWDETEKDRLWNFMVGNDGEILLDFNVDGPIHTKLGLPKVRR